MKDHSDYISDLHVHNRQEEDGRRTGNGDGRLPLPSNDPRRLASLQISKLRSMHVTGKERRRLLRQVQALYWGIRPAPDTARLMWWLAHVTCGQGKTLPQKSENFWVSQAQEWLKTPTGPSAAWWLEAIFWVIWMRLWPRNARDIQRTLLARIIDHLPPEQITPERLTGADQWGAILRHELLLTLVVLLGECMREADEQARRAVEFLNRSVAASLDEEGSVRHENRSWILPALASWIRCSRLCRGHGVALWTPESHESLSRCFAQALRWAGPDGSLLLDTQKLARWSSRFLRSGWKACGKPDALARPVAALCPARRKKRKGARRADPTASWIAEQAGVTLLRRGWSLDSPVLACSHQPGWMAELWTRCQCWLAGPVTTLVQMDDNTYPIQGPAELVCEFIDKRMRYAEWQVRLQNGWIVQRQLALAPEDGFFLWADAVIGNQPRKWQYELRWPLAPQIGWQSGRETHEGWLADRSGRKLLVLPLAFPEWRMGFRSGALRVEQGELVATLSGTGRAFFVPLFFDVQLRPADTPLTWRHLTVGCQMRRVAADEAVGYRVQLGKKQWVVYRSLHNTQPRTLLGQHWSAEFAIGRLRRRGDCRILIEVESSDE
ncbi:MAG: hypothetical protein KatS3mg110_0137 [Pirellulaceae bacterium]|nr:MAG: hypothetical protein KatS3mg110_0137 [Pirellulaceae bacterium]